MSTVQRSPLLRRVGLLESRMTHLVGEVASHWGGYDANAVVAEAAARVGVSPERVKDVLRARDYSLVELQFERDSGVYPELEQQTLPELIQRARVALAEGPITYEYVTRFIQADTGIELPVVLGVLAAELGYMQRMGLVSLETAQAYRYWMARRHGAILPAKEVDILEEVDLGRELDLASAMEASVNSDTVR